jgi:hypothetical protein
MNAAAALAIAGPLFARWRAGRAARRAIRHERKAAEYREIVAEQNALMRDAADGGLIDLEN